MSLYIITRYCTQYSKWEGKTRARHRTRNRVIGRKVTASYREWTVNHKKLSWYSCISFESSYYMREYVANMIWYTDLFTKRYITVALLTRWLPMSGPRHQFMGQSWGPPWFCRPQMGPMLAPWTLPSGPFQGMRCWPKYHHDVWPQTSVHGAIMGPTLVLSAPDGPHVGPMNLSGHAMLAKIPPWRPMLHTDTNIPQTMSTHKARQSVWNLSLIQKERLPIIITWINYNASFDQYVPLQNMHK